MTKTDWAYLAGIIDGEGSIFLQNGTCVCISISTTSPMLKKRLLGMGLRGQGVRVYEAEPEQSSIYSRLPIYSLRAYGKNAVNILEHTLPYLSIKSKKAKLALRFRKTQTKSKTHRFRGVPGREKKLRESYAAMIREA